MSIIPNRHPGKLDKINYVINFFMDMCDAPLSVYIKTLFPALMEAFITYYEIDVVQIFTGWVRPGGPLRGRRGGGHRPSRPKPKPKRTWLRRAFSWTSFDPWDELGRRLPFADDLHGRHVTPGVITMWNIYDRIQVVQYWIMVYEITEQFFYRWTSGVANSKYCQAQYRPWIYGESSLQGNLGILPSTPCVIERIVKARHYAHAGGNGMEVLGFGSSAVFTVTFIDDNPNDPKPGKKLLITHESGIRAFGPDMMQTGQQYTVSLEANSEGMFFFYTTGPGNYVVIECEFTVIGWQNYIELPDD